MSRHEEDPTALYLGIDIGSTTVKVVLVDRAGCPVAHSYRYAHGRPAVLLHESLERLAQEYDLGQVRGVGVTGSGAGRLAPVLGGVRVNELVAQARAVQDWAPDARTVIEIGGQDSKLLVLEPDGRGRLLLVDTAMNDLCAAGTGAFLDQQAERLGLTVEELAGLARASRHPARVAGRCTVFARSDMVHLQQRGVAQADIVAGLCLALAGNYRSTVGAGKPFHRPIVFQGGVARNAGMVWALKQVLGLGPGELLVPPHCTLMAALGAAYIARDEGAPFASTDWVEVDAASGAQSAGDGRSTNGAPLAPEELPKAAAAPGDRCAGKTHDANGAPPFRGLGPLAELLSAPVPQPAALPPLGGADRNPHAVDGFSPPLPYPHKVWTLNRGVFSPQRTQRAQRKASKNRLDGGEIWKSDDKTTRSAVRQAAYLGVDVGSISTKVVLRDAAGRVLSGCYIPTAGRPLEAVRQGLAQMGQEAGARVQVAGVGVTGSGRELVGYCIGADVVVDEITAQARAAAAFDPAADTVLEIGGQDSKYIALRDGAVVDFTMNRACAAGTGAFLEEQAQRLGLPVEELGRLALRAPAPVDLGERCTVFVEADLVHHQQRGTPPEDLAAGAAYAVARNYLERVVGGKTVGQRVLFQGGVAANPAVVAALERLLGRPVAVPPHHRLSGAIGAALLAQEREASGPSRFRGFDLTPELYQSTTFACSGCANRCTVHQIRVSGAERPFTYGSRCERYDGGDAAGAAGERANPQGRDKGKMLLGTARPDLFAEREALLVGEAGNLFRGIKLGPFRYSVPSPRPRVGIPRVLFFHDLWPYWRRFFQEVGWEAVLSPPSTADIVVRSTREAGTPTCLPVKLAVGHVHALLEAGVDAVFLPALVNRPDIGAGHEQSYHCPWIQAAGHLVEAALHVQQQVGGAPETRPCVQQQGCCTPKTPLWIPPLHMQWDVVYRQDLARFAAQLGVSPRRAWQAHRQAAREQARRETAWRTRGAEVLAGLGPGETAVVIVGRAYNTADPGVNGGLPRHLRRLGWLTLPMDLLPLEGIKIGDLASNMFWHSGQHILAAARLIRQDPRLHAIYVTHFGCGPDSFLLTFFRQAMAGKPFLEVELDDHSADTGLVTRLEAFHRSAGRPRPTPADILGQVASSPLSPPPRGAPPLPFPQSGKGRGAGGEERVGDRPIFEPDTDTSPVPGRPESGHSAPRGRPQRERRVYLPHVCDAVLMLAAAMRRYGIQAEVLPPPDEETLVLGRKRCLGRECLPCYTIVGDIVRQARQDGFDPAASLYLVPTSAGPCRLGQFHDLLRQVLDRQGLHELRVCAPSAENGYQYEGMGVPPLLVGRLAWQGTVGVDLLEKLRLSHRPYEQVPGSADALYQALLADLARDIEAGGDRRAAAVMAAAREQFDRLAVDRSRERPRIGLVGELYVRLNPFTNQDIVRRVEALGGEVWMAPMSEWPYYANRFARFTARAGRRYKDLLRLLLARPIMQWEERRMLAPLSGYLPNAAEPETAALLEAGRPYFHPILRTEAPLSIGKAIDLARQGADGILNVLPFTCMPSTVVMGLAPRIRADLGGIPWLDLVLDGLGETQQETRLEAFVHQARDWTDQPHTL